MWDASTLNMESMGSVSCRVGGSGMSSSLMRYAELQVDSVGIILGWNPCSHTEDRITLVGCARRKTIENCKFCFQNPCHTTMQLVGVSHSTIRNSGRKSGLNRDWSGTCGLYQSNGWISDVVCMFHQTQVLMDIWTWPGIGWWYQPFNIHACQPPV